MVMTGNRSFYSDPKRSLFHPALPWLQIFAGQIFSFWLNLVFYDETVAKTGKWNNALRRSISGAL